MLATKWQVKVVAEDFVCKLCGDTLQKKQLFQKNLDNEAVLYCKNCDQLESGTYRELYDLAEEYVELSEFNYFPEMDEDIRAQRLNVGKVCQILMQCCLDHHIYDRKRILQDTSEILVK